MTIKQAIARVAHEANRAICEAAGDHSQLPWEQAEQWQRDSAVKGVEFVIDNPDAKPSDQHDAWMADKIKDGWIWGEVKDAEKKTHPCIKPYELLPFRGRVKDHVFRSIVKSIYYDFVVSAEETEPVLKTSPVEPVVPPTEEQSLTQ